MLASENKAGLGVIEIAPSSNWFPVNDIVFATLVFGVAKYATLFELGVKAGFIFDGLGQFFVAIETSGSRDTAA